MDFKTLLIGFVKTELSFYFVTSLAESVFVSVSIKKVRDTELQRAVILLFMCKNDSSKRNCTIAFLFYLLDYCI